MLNQRLIKEVAKLRKENTSLKEDTEILQEKCVNITNSNEGLIKKVEELTNELIAKDDMMKKIKVEEMKRHIIDAETMTNCVEEIELKCNEKKIGLFEKHTKGIGSCSGDLTPTTRKITYPRSFVS